MSSISLAQATTIIDSALAEARRNNFRPIIVLVLDDGGHVIALKREDGTGYLATEIAWAKAWGAVGMGSASRILGERMEARPAVVAAIAAASQGRFMAIPGGVLIRDASGRIVGAVGASGETSDNDEKCAIAGVKATGLIADNGKG